MMEFTLSRVTVSVCALMLLASLVPHLDTYSQQRLDSEASSLAASFDLLLCSVARTEAEIWVDGSEVVPRGWTVELSPGVMVLDDGEKEFVRQLKAPYAGETVRLDRDCRFLLFTSESDGVVSVHLQKVETISSTASPSLETSSWSL